MRQGFFRGLSGLGGRRNQETPQPPPSNIALRCPRRAPERKREGAQSRRTPRRRSKQAAARARVLLQLAPHLFPGSRVAYGRRVPDGIAAVALSPCKQATGEATAAHASCSRARCYCAFAAATALLLICYFNTASQVLQTPQLLDRSCVLVATCKLKQNR